MLACGTVPVKDLPLTLGRAVFEGEFLSVNGFKVPCAQGTAAMIGSALSVADCLKLEPPQALV